MAKNNLKRRLERHEFSEGDRVTLIQSFMKGSKLQGKFQRAADIYKTLEPGTYYQKLFEIATPNGEVQSFLEGYVRKLKNHRLDIGEEPAEFGYSIRLSKTAPHHQYSKESTAQFMIFRRHSKENETA